LERCVANLQDANHIADSVLTGYHKYHFSLLHKLKSAEHNIQRLEDILTNTATEDIVSGLEEFTFLVNMSIDGFFYTGGSALDILAREVLTYFSIPLPHSVYYRTARQELSNHRPGDPLLPRLDDPNWKLDFSNYRNTLTHELLIAGEFSINVKLVGRGQKTQIVFPLPDDPRETLNDRVYNKYPDVLEYCTMHFRRILSLINQIYGDIADRAIAANALPL
jgi:hypothetical protein